jgi:hypothetical protein
MKAILFMSAAAAVALFMAAPAGAQDGAATSERVSRVIVYGNDPCPRGDGEIIICGRRPDSERYRVPEELRDDVAERDPDNESWAVQAQSLEFVGRSGIQSCSTSGPGGSTGCWAEMMRAWRNERRVEGEAGR